MGYDVHRINFNGGDLLFGSLKGTVSFSQDLAVWPKYLEDKLVEWNVTDIILFGDCRPLHREAVRLATLRGVRVYVVDEGYIRPNWVTVEKGGVNGNSSLPRDPSWYRNAVLDVPEWDPGVPVVGSFRRRAFEDVAYNVASVALRLAFPQIPHAPVRGIRLSNMPDGCASSLRNLPRNGGRIAVCIGL